MQPMIPFVLVTLSAALGAQDLEVRGFANLHRFKPDRLADRVVVQFTIPGDPAALDAALRPFGARWQQSGLEGAFEVLEVQPGTVDLWCAWLEEQALVRYAEPDHLAYTCEEPSDPYFKPYQWNLYDKGVLSNGYASNFGVQAMSAWNTAKGQGAVVAIVDTGVAYENYAPYRRAPDLSRATFVSPYNFVANTTHANDDNGHGTHVTGTVRQASNNSKGTAGIAQLCSIMPVKVLDASGAGSYTAIADGVRWAADHGANVINMSLGGSSGDTTLRSAIDYAWSKGVVLCAATGNSGAASIGYPAKYTNCIAVGATRFDGTRCAYSQYGSGIDVVAPGGDTSVDQNHDGYGDGILQQTFSGSPTNFVYSFFQGTSMATPHVTAIAALVKGNKPSYTSAQVRKAIESSCTDLGAAGYDTVFGWGLVDAALALTK